MEYPMDLIMREDEVDAGGTQFDEEAMARDEFQIEEIIEAYKEEPSIRHDVYPDSENDEEEADIEGELTNILRGDMMLYLNQTFFNAVAFKESVLDYALKIGRNLKQYMYDKDRVGYKCVGSSDCEWQIYCSILPSSLFLKVRGFKDKHICVPNGDCEMIMVPVIAKLFVDKIREKPDYFMPMKIEKTIKERWKITMSRGQCQIARNKTLKWIENEYDLQFARLRDYTTEIMNSNHDLTAKIDT